MLGTTLLALLALCGVFTFILLKVERLAVFAPKGTGRIAESAAAYCADPCRLTHGRCP